MWLFWLYRAPPCPAVVLTAPSIGKPIRSLQELVLAVCFCDPRTFAVQALSFLWTSCVWDWTVCKSIQILRSPARKQYYLNIPFWSSNHRRTSELTHRHWPSIKSSSKCSKMKILGWGRKEAESWSFWECGAGYAEWTEWTSWWMDFMVISCNMLQLNSSSVSQSDCDCQGSWSLWSRLFQSLCWPLVNH